MGAGREHQRQREFRAYVADKTPEEQRGMGFDAKLLHRRHPGVVTGMLPYMLKNWFGVSDAADGSNALPTNVKISFYLSRRLPRLAVLWTIFTS